MIRPPRGSTPWVMVGAGVAAGLGVLLLLSGGRETQPTSSTVVARKTSPDAARPVSDEKIEMAAVGIIELVDSNNTPSSLLASLALTGAGAPGADRVEIDIPLPLPEAPIPAAPESRLSEAAPEAPMDSIVPPPPDNPSDLTDQRSESSAPREASSPAAMVEMPGGGGVNGLLIPPVVIKAAWLEYPREARKRKSEGSVEVRILVDLDGQVSAVEVERGTSDESLNQAALAAARLMRFRAARQGGRPVAVWFNYQFSFRLPS